MPGYKCSIKDRMLYSTCKGPLLDVATDRVGLEIARKVNNEVSSILVSRRKIQLFAWYNPKKSKDWHSRLVCGLPVLEISISIHRCDLKSLF